MNTQPVIYIALPAMDEIAVIGKTIECIRKQTFKDFHLFVCVNQPEIYHQAPAYSHIISSNRKTIEMLGNVNDIKITVIDRSSPGNGWDEKNYGVGWARKVLFDAILELAEDKDVIVSMDADTVFHERFLEMIVDKFRMFPSAVALANPYYHALSGDKELDRVMLRYEMYMRYYALNLWRIGSPYNFTPLGSAISFSVSAYRKMSGVAPKFSGEDFYLLQKLRKSGRILHFNEELVYPATRYSDRVFFGTGPALIKGRTGDWSSYPFYSPVLFNKIAEFYHYLPLMFERDIATSADDFIQESFGKSPLSLWEELRLNNSDTVHFMHACHVKFDGLRVLQFLRYYHFHKNEGIDTHTNLYDYLNTYHADSGLNFKVFRKLDFKRSKVRKLNAARNMLFEIEQSYRLKDHQQNIEKNPQSHPERWKFLGS